MLAYVESKNAKVFPIGLRVQMENGERMLQVFGMLMLTIVELPQTSEDGEFSIIEQRSGRLLFLPGWYTEELRIPTEQALKDVFQLDFVELYHSLDNAQYEDQRNPDTRTQILESLRNKEITTIQQPSN